MARLDDLGWKRQVWKDDIRRIDRCRHQVDVVFHLAAVTRRERFVAEPHESYDINVTGALATLDYCQKVGARCVFTSTSAVYDAGASQGPLAEDGPVKPTLLYGVSKWVAENICRRHQTPVVILRLFNVYGPGQHPDFLVPYIIDCLQQRRPITLRMPQAQRDFVYVDDVVSALIKAGQVQGANHAIFNIGSGQATRIIDFLRLAEKIWGKSAGEIETGQSNQGEVPAAIANIAQARRGLGWRPQYDLATGLKTMRDSDRNKSLKTS